jgi:hypothetical protein
MAKRTDDVVEIDGFLVGRVVVTKRIMGRAQAVTIPCELVSYDCLPREGVANSV